MSSSRAGSDQVASLITAQLLFLEAENPKKEISIYINSPGGIVTSAMSIFDTMQFIRPAVATLCIGQSRIHGRASACGRREGHALCVAQRSHPVAPALGRLPGTGERHRAPRRGHHQNEAAPERDLCPPHRPDYATIEKTLDRDYFLSAEDARTFGIVDEVIIKRHPLDETIQKLMPVS